MRSARSPWRLPSLDGCEKLSLLSLEGEYISFLVELENERTLLEHLLSCEKCMGSLRGYLKEGDHQALGDLTELFQPSSVELRASQVEEILVDRITKLKGLASDTEDELKGIKRDLGTRRGPA